MPSEDLARRAVVTAMGAAMEGGAKVTFPITGFAYGSFTRRSVQFG